MRNPARSVYAHHILHPAMGASISRVELRFEAHAAVVWVAFGGHTNMAGTITECMKMDPDIRNILAVSACVTDERGKLIEKEAARTHILDTQYFKADARWHAIRWDRRRIAVDQPVQMPDGSVLPAVDAALLIEPDCSDSEDGWPHEKALEYLREALLQALRDTRNPPRLLVCWKCGKPATWTGDYSTGCDEHTQEPLNA